MILADKIKQQRMGEDPRIFHANRSQGFKME